MVNKSINPDKIKGLLIILDRDNEKGLQHWIDELQKRNIPAVVQVHKPTLENRADMMSSIADLGFEIGGSSIEYFWDKPYEVQLKALKELKSQVENGSRKPMRIFNFKYFSCDETTLKAADSLGIEYVFMRGTGAEAKVYKTPDYKARILSVSNVPSSKLGTGSLCDESLCSRGERPEYLHEILLNLKTNRVILVAQTHLSGVKLHWWNVYQELFDAGIVEWQTLDEFASQAIELPFNEIPVNQQVDYITPQPQIPLEDEVEFPFGE